MTWTIDNTEGERDRYYRATTRRSPRESTGRVIYPLEFWNHARLNVALNSGTPRSRSAAREDAREPSSPLSPVERLSIYYMEHEWIASIIVGLFIAGFAATFAAWIVW